jgi:hypothetical protein
VARSRRDAAPAKPRPAVAPPADRPRRSRLHLAVVGLALAAGLVLAGRAAWLCDDIFITFRYAANVLAGHGVVYNVGERVEGFTHPLWLALITAWRWAGGAPEPFVIALGLAAYGGLILLCGLRRGAFPFAAVLLALHHDVHVWATSGLETMAFALAAAAAALAMVDRRWPLAGVALAAAALLRPDGLVLAAVALAWAAFDRGRARAWVLLPFAVVGTYVAWRLAYYGDLLPNPYYAKSAGRSYWDQGAFYVWTYLRNYFSSVVFLIAVPFVRRREVGLPLGFAAAYLVLFVMRVGGDFMYARFLVPVVPLLALAVQPVLRGRAAVAVTAAAAVVLLFDGSRSAGRAAGAGPDSDLGARGIADEYRYYTRDVGGGMNRIEQGRMIGTALRRYLAGEPVRVLLRGQAALAYYAEFAVAIEGTGLTDRAIARMPIAARGRPGHEKEATLEQMRERRVDFVFSRPRYDPRSRQIGFGVGEFLFPAEIITETGLAERLAERFPGEVVILPPSAVTTAR